MKKTITDKMYSPVIQNGGSSQLPLLLSILALIGTVYTFSKVQSLEKLVGNGAAKVAQVQPTDSQPAEPTPNLSAMPNVTDKDHVLGNLNDASVVLVEYSDYQCPYCQRFHPTMQQVMKEYGKKVAWVFRQYPLPFHPFAQKAAEASECVAKLGGNDKFWKFTDTAYVKGTSDVNFLAVDSLVKLAGELGVDTSKVKTCIDSGEMAQTVKDQMAGGSAAGVNGTPGTIAVSKNGTRQLIGGAYPFEQVKKIIDSLLN